MPRKAKPAAVPVEMPRTEKDFDLLTSGIEAHIAQGNRIGELYRDGKITAEEALQQGGDRDEKLYNLNDRIQAERESERDNEIKKES